MTDVLITDTTGTCPTCGGTDIVEVPRPGGGSIVRCVEDHGAHASQDFDGWYVP